MGYLWLAECSHKTIVALTGHSNKTITDYLGYYRDLVAGSLDADDTQIGGEGIEVEIDESKFARRKYNRGHRIEGCWIVGGVERTAERRLFVETVESRSREALIDVIRRHVIPGSVVLTDMWRGYAGLADLLDVEHRTVNHSREFVDPVTGTHTNHIEATWAGMKRRIPIRNRNADTIGSHLLEFIWRRLNKDDLWAGLLRAMRITHYE
jgi:hypothetical protein